MLCNVITGVDALDVDSLKINFVSDDWKYLTIDRRAGNYKVVIWKDKPRWNREWKGSGEHVVVIERSCHGIVDHMLFVLRDGELVWC